MREVNQTNQVGTKANHVYKNGEGKGASYAEVMTSFDTFEEELMTRFFPQEAKKKGEWSIHSLVNLGNPASLFYRIADRIDNKDYEFLARYYSKIPEAYMSINGIAPWERANMAYEFLHEAGVTNVLKSFLPDGSKTLFLEWLGEETLEKVLKEKPKEKMDITDDILEILALFQYRTSEKLKELPDDARKRLFASRTVLQQAEDYFSTINKKGDEECVRRFVSSYELIDRATRGNEVNDGDLGPRNIILSKNGIYIIDPELKLRNEFNDIGSLFAYCGKLFDMGEWDEKARKFKKIKLEGMIEEEGGVLSWPKKRWIRARQYPTITIGEKEEKEALFALYGSIFHHSLRIIAKNQVSHRYESCKEQEDNLLTVLEEFRRDPQKFGLSYLDVTKARTLRMEYEEAVLT